MRFLHNQSSDEEAAWVSEYIHAHPAILDEYFDVGTFGKDPSENDLIQFTRERQKRIKNAVFREVDEKAEKERTVWRWMAAAALVLLIGGSYWLVGVQSKEKKEKVLLAAQSNQWLLENNTAGPMEKVLSDGSLISLEPGTKLYAYRTFKKQRTVYLLKGAAGFKVRRDTARPFTVYASGISTTALGTEFKVKVAAGGKKVNVELLSGKVLVQSSETAFKMKDYILHPGQTLKVDKDQIDVQLSSARRIMRDHASANSQADKNVKGARTVWTNKGFQFSKQPLSTVFERLEKKYQVKIIASGDLIQHKRFTGKIMYSDSLQTIMQVICDLNDLKIKRSGDSLIIIHK